MLCRNSSGVFVRLQSWMNCEPFLASSENRIPLLPRMPTGIAADRSPAAHQLVAEQRLELLEPAAVEQPSEHLADVERDAHVGRRAPDQFGRVVQRIVGRLGRAGPEPLPTEVADDLAGDAQAVELVGGEVVGQAARSAVHLGTAERLLVDDLVDRHLHERRPAEIGRAATLDEHRVVAHPRRVRTAGGVRAERDRDRRNAHLRHLGEVAEARPALDEQVGLAGQVGAGRLVEQDQREPVLLDDLVEALLLAPARRVRRAAAVGHVRAADRHQRVLDDPDHVDDAGTDRVLGAPRGERAQLEQRGVRVDEQLDAFTDEQLLARVMPVDVALPADRRHLRELRGDRVPQRLHLRRGSPGSRRTSGRAGCAAPFRWSPAGCSPARSTPRPRG